MATKMVENITLESSDTIDAAEPNTSEIKKLADKINGFLAGNDTGEFNSEILASLRKMRDNLKNMDIRKKLDEILYKINVNIETVTVFQDEHITNQEKNQVDVFTVTDKCCRELTNTRDLIQSCINRHTELYVMGQQYDELISNTELLKVKIAILNVGNDFTKLLRRFTNEVIKEIKTVCSRFSGLERLGNWLIGIFKFFSGEQNTLDGIKQYCLEFTSSGINANLGSLLKQLTDTKEDILGKDNSQLESNVIMKAYKDYRRTYEKVRDDPENENESDEELHRQVRKYGASNCIEPVMDRFKDISKSEAWELMDAIHFMVIRK